MYGRDSLEFEDEEYKYYVRAVPKAMVTKESVKIKRIYSRKRTDSSKNPEADGGSGGGNGSGGSGNGHASSSGGGSSNESGSGYGGYGSSSGSGSSYSSGSSGEYSSSELFFSLIIAGAIIVYMIYRTAKENIIPNYTPTDDSKVEALIKHYIPTFDKAQFLQDGFKIYKDVQDAWMNFKLDDVKDVITDELYNMYESQLATLKVKGEQNIMKDFVLKKSFLKDVSVQNDTITINTRYIIEFYDYIANRNTGETIRGNSERKMRVRYEMKFRQSLDQSKVVDKCPSCGAPIKINSFGTCEYCKAKIVTENTKWVLTEKKVLNQYYS